MAEARAAVAGRGYGEQSVLIEGIEVGPFQCIDKWNNNPRMALDQDPGKPFPSAKLHLQAAAACRELNILASGRSAVPCSSGEAVVDSLSMPDGMRRSEPCCTHAGIDDMLSNK